MNVLVTGGAGYIGSVCVEELLNAGHDVTVYDDLSEGHRSAVDNRAVFIQAGLSDQASLVEAMRDAKPAAVLHFAGSALVGESMTNPSKYFRNNVCNGLNLLDAAAGAGVKKFVFSSSCATYGPPDRVPMTEDLPQRPINPYGESKLMFERMLDWQGRIHGLEFVALRYFNAAGASAQFGEHHRVETHLIPNVLKVALGQSQHCEMFGTDYPTPDGTCIRDYIHIVDLAQAHILALAAGEMRLLQSGQRRRLFGEASDCGLRENHPPAHSLSGEAAPGGRSSAAGGFGGESPPGTGLETPIPRTGDHHHRRLALARRPPARLRGLDGRT